ncbi:hypothetical protein K458DRAFT_391850 [Lentithecium fluviatile CBS 122367]|uniref:Uncharacterized protein n=1 Tax=Lentithecium fluviatile CBS 122367 TaxID=1168545 RepID=A0A6G1IT90_9PLEO|nr:hypothetical protein K458DRAFT_391850 [Lentithecium fluviatile CBS 122367]
MIKLLANMDPELAHEILAAMSTKRHIQPASSPSCNEAAASSPSSATPNDNPAVQKWLDGLPSDPSDLYRVSKRPMPNLSVWKDWLHWSKTEALDVLASLDAKEHRYRQLGLQYHSISRGLRLQPTQPDRTAINHKVITRLMDILEKDTPRVRQAWFMPWHKASMFAAEIVKMVEEAHPLTTADSLMPVHKECQAHLCMATKFVHDIHRKIRGLEAMVEAVCMRSQRKGEEGTKVDLGKRWSREGEMFRVWIGTFPEIVEVPELKKLKMVDELAGEMCVIGVRKDVWWSKTARDGEIVAKDEGGMAFRLGGK